MIYYLPIAGTHSQQDGWVVDNHDPFTLMMHANKFVPLRRADGLAWNWSTQLQGLWFLTGSKVWYRTAVDLAQFLQDVPYEARNLIAHSHGGQPAIIAAAFGLRLRTLTTVGTPRRRDVPAEQARPNIGYWQHIHDQGRDWIATLRRLGQIGDGTFSRERRFLIPGVTNIGVKGIGHSAVLRDPEAIKMWETQGWLEAIRCFDQEQT